MTSDTMTLANVYSGFHVSPQLCILRLIQGRVSGIMAASECVRRYGFRRSLLTKRHLVQCITYGIKSIESMWLF
jgi:hypothetical protein